MKLTLLKILQIFDEADYLQMKEMEQLQSKEELRLGWLIRLFPRELNIQVKEDSSSISKLFENCNYTKNPPPKRTYGNRWLLAPLMQEIYTNKILKTNGDTFLKLTLEQIQDTFQIQEYRLPEIVSSVQTLIAESDLWDERLHIFIDDLCRTGSINSMAYALFLLILCSLYNWDIRHFDYLYSSYIMMQIHSSEQNFYFLLKAKSVLKQEAYDFYSSKEMLQYIHDSHFSQPLKRSQENREIDHCFFDGDSYLHEYYFYSYHPTHREIICGESKLRFEMRERGKYEVHLTLSENGIIRECWGTAMQNPNTKLVYVILHEMNKKETMILSFLGQHFNSRMFYRPAFLLRHFPGTFMPMIEKVCISLYPVEADVVKGLLNMQDTFFVSRSRLKDFIYTYRQEEWMTDFSELPKIRNFLSATCTPENAFGRPDGLFFTDQFILGIDLSHTFDREQEIIDRLLILQLLKSFSTNRIDTISLKEPENMHMLIRDHGMKKTVT
ncbi:MAG: hypothetical protein SOW08_13525 [Lachnospiraceae bacterium]|nr:hypothetical protein [Lachnospiraceae bacterium]